MRDQPSYQGFLSLGFRERFCDLSVNLFGIQSERHAHKGMKPTQGFMLLNRSPRRLYPFVQAAGVRQKKIVGADVNLDRRDPMKIAVKAAFLDPVSLPTNGLLRARRWRPADRARRRCAMAPHQVAGAEPWQDAAVGLEVGCCLGCSAARPRGCPGWRRIG